MQRRQFLKAAAGTLIVSPGGIGSAEEAAGQTVGDARMERIGCTTVSFRSRFPATREDKTPAVGDLSLPEVPRWFAGHLGIRNVELWSKHFTDTTLDYCRSIKSAAEQAGTRIVNIQLDDAYNLSHPDEAQRARSIALVTDWLDRAAACGSPSLRANTGGGKEPFDLRRTGDAYRKLAEHGQRVGVKVLIENHGGYSMDADHVTALVEYVASPFCRALADTGNLPPDISQAEREDFLKKLLPHAELISAKGMVFDDACRHTSYDVAACVRLAEACGFRGIYSIELWDRTYEPPDPVRAVREMRRLIVSQLS